MKTLPVIEKANIHRWLYKNKSSDSTLNSPIKNEIRDIIAGTVSNNGSYLGLWGAQGEDYFKVKRAHPEARIRMLDNGKGFKNKDELIKMQNQIPELKIQDLNKFMEEGKETFEVFWDDLCGPMGEYVLKQLALIPRILQGNGHFFLTIMETRDPFFQPWMTREEKRELTIKLVKDELAIRGVLLTINTNIHYNSIPMSEFRKTMRTTPMWTVGGPYIKI